MFLVSIAVLACTGYLFHRYHMAANKDRFFRSPLFVSLTGCFAILVSTVLIVNVFSPDLPRDPKPVPSALTLTGEELNTSYDNLITKGPAFHYVLISKVALDPKHETIEGEIKKHYRKFLRGDKALTQLGNFCLGVFAFESRKYEEAQNYLSRVNDDFPYLNFMKGKMALIEKRKDEAESYFKRELTVAGGNTRGAYLKLVSLYDESEDYEGLRGLLNHEQAATYFPEYLARITLLNTGDFAEYVLWIYRSILNKTNLPGLIAAFLISLVWILYLFQLQVFRANRYALVSLMFVSGMLSVFVLLTFSDMQDIVAPWALNGEFLNDLLYCIFLIGAPEEFVKFFPLLMLLMFQGSFREPVDYIILACASALGFAFVENLLYFQKMNGSIIHGRAYFAVIGHMIDASFVAYAYVVARFQFRNRSSIVWLLPLTFLAGSVAHGIYDFLLFHEHLYIFFVFFILAIQLWVIIINNCLNNSSRFSYKLASRSEQSRVYIAMALTVIFAFEYSISGFNQGLYEANTEFLANIPFAGILILFFSSNLSTFDLVKGYWRNVHFTSRQKHGYGARPASSLLVSWYLINSVKAQNYVGLKIRIFSDPYNKLLRDIFQGSSFSGTIVNRVVLHEGDVSDPHWFIVRMDTPVPFENERHDYILLKLRYEADSLITDDAVQIFFKSIPDAALLRKTQPVRSDFPFYGWAFAALVDDESYSDKKK